MVSKKVDSNLFLLYFCCITVEGIMLQDRKSVVESLLPKVDEIDNQLTKSAITPSRLVLETYLSAVRGGEKGINYDVHFRAIEILKEVTGILPLDAMERGEGGELSNLVGELILEVSKSNLT